MSESEIEAVLFVHCLFRFFFFFVERSVFEPDNLHVFGCLGDAVQRQRQAFCPSARFFTMTLHQHMMYYK